jgi:hypothetical protein
MMKMSMAGKLDIPRFKKAVLALFCHNRAIPRVGPLGLEFMVQNLVKNRAKTAF